MSAITPPQKMIQTNITVTLTEKELAFRERAREAGLPTIVVSMYAGALQRLVDKEYKLRSQPSQPKKQDEVP
jgi:hypothetical protein